MTSTSSRTVLVVDDREENRYILSHLLRRGGFAVAEARDGKEGLARAAEHPDLVVLDVKLPDITGYEVCRRIKNNPATAGIPVLQLSASFVSAESKVQALEGGADAYLVQPVDPVVFIATVKALLRLRHAENLSRLTARQWQTTFDALNDGIALLDADHSVLRCNRGLAQMLRCRYDELEGQDALQVVRERLGVEQPLDPLAAARQTHEVRRQDRWYRLTLDPILDEAGAATGAVLILVDVSEHRRAEEALRLQDRLASTGRMAHVIAHEINNPLEALTNLLYLLQNHVRSDGEQYLLAAQQELDRISRITKQTLAFSRDTARPVPVDFKELLSSVVMVAKMDSPAAVRIHTECRVDTPFAGFPGEIRQILLNVVRNSVESLPGNGDVWVKVRSAHDHRSQASGVRMLVCDNGSGIPPEVRDSLFEPFVSSKELRGSGLGLWLSRTLVVRRGGSIRFRSRTGEGSGTCFSIVLPSASK